MQNTLKEALKSSMTLNFKNNSDTDKKVAVLPGIYDTLKLAGAGENAVLTYTDPTNLNRAGYNVDEVADDYNDKSGVSVAVTGTKRASFRDFRNAVNLVGLTVSRIVIQNKVESQNLYDQEIEVARTVLGAKGGTDFIQLQNYVSVNAYDRTKIEINLADDPLVLTPEVFMSIVVPGKASFSMQFIFETI